MVLYEASKHNTFLNYFDFQKGFIVHLDTPPLAVDMFGWLCLKITTFVS